MLKNKGGFTLIELVMIIVILGILAAVAIPRYIDLQADALDAALEGVCGGLKSSAGVLIVSSWGSGANQKKGDLKDVDDVISNTDTGNASVASAAASTTVTITLKSSTRTCDLSKVAVNP